ncbi:hypothetical protein N7488_004908 [Penicillium malachiteum]|nr:hypothetical protein N7488_004908 [Penicillium malachiteum]
MAPRKSKSVKDTKTDDDATLVLNYLREQKSDAYHSSFLLLVTILTKDMSSRPYSAIEISANLHNQVSKAQAAKILKELHQKKEIEERTAGKQVVYHAIQDSSQSVTPKDLATLTKNIERLQNELITLRADEKKVRAAFAAFESKPLFSDLRQDIERLQEERETLQERLGNQAASDEVPLSVEERENLENEWTEWQRHATLRRRMCRDLWGRCTEVLPENMTLPELWESLGLEGSLQ